MDPAPLIGHIGESKDRFWLLRLSASEWPSVRRRLLAARRDFVAVTVTDVTCRPVAVLALATDDLGLATARPRTSPADAARWASLWLRCRFPGDVEASPAWLSHLAGRLPARSPRTHQPAKAGGQERA